MLESMSVHAVPFGPVGLYSDQGASMTILGFIRFHFTLGTSKFPVEIFIVSHLGSEKVLIGSMASFQAVLDSHLGK